MERIGRTIRSIYSLETENNLKAGNMLTYAVIDKESRMTIHLFPPQNEDIKRCFIIYRHKDENNQFDVCLKYINECGNISEGYGDVGKGYSIELVETKGKVYKYVLKRDGKVLYNSPSFEGDSVNDTPLVYTWKLFINITNTYNSDEIIELYCKLAERDNNEIMTLFDKPMNKDGFLKRMGEDEKQKYKHVLEKL